MQNQIFAFMPPATKAIRFAVAIAGLVVCSTSQQALACVAGEFSPVGGFVSAPLVFVGEITDSQAITGTKSTLITLQVSERLIGVVPHEIALVWNGHPEGLTAPMWSGDPHVMIAAVPPRTGKSSGFGLSYEDADPSLPAVIGGFCTPYRILSADDHWVNEIREAIRQQRP